VFYTSVTDLTGSSEAKVSVQHGMCGDYHWAVAGDAMCGPAGGGARRRDEDTKLEIAGEGAQPVSLHSVNYTSLWPREISPNNVGSGHQWPPGLTRQSVSQIDLRRSDTGGTPK
jgi:hypothetical protein